LTFRHCVALVLIVTFCGALSRSQTAGVAPSASSTSSAKPSKTTTSKSSKPKLDAKQKQAIDILQSVESELARFSPEMQTWLLQVIARAYKQIDRAKQVAALKQALQAATSIPEGEYRNQQETSIVNELDKADPGGLASLQNPADAKVRETVLQLLVKQDFDHSRVIAAAQRLSQWDPSLAFPYQYAKQVIASLKSAQSGERQAVFSSAVNSFRNADINMMSEDQMTNLVLGTYDLLPAPSVLEGIDLILSRASKYTEEENFSVTVGGKDGEATFSSMYDFKLFELLPVLDKLDPAKAEALRRDHSNIAALNKKCPNGMSSLSPDSHMRQMMTSGDDPQGGAKQLALNQQARMADSIVDASAKDVDSALANAQSLSNVSPYEYDPMTPRCQVLERIATEAAARKNFVAAERAVKALTSASQDVPPLAQAHYLIRAAAITAQMNDPQAGKQYLARAMKSADELYHKDAFGDPPNGAPKAIWPSTAVWTAILIVDEHIDSDFALQQATSLPDPEIEAVANVAIASVMLGQEPGMTHLAIWHNGKPETEMMFDIPWWDVQKSSNDQMKAQAAP
jgi:hypothetical protein